MCFDQRSPRSLVGAIEVEALRRTSAHCAGGFDPTLPCCQAHVRSCGGVGAARELRNLAAAQRALASGGYRGPSV
jgi:hypothetical protein